MLANPTMNKLSPEAIKQTLAKLRDMIKKRKSQESIHQGKFDEVYFYGINLLEQPCDCDKHC